MALSDAQIDKLWRWCMNNYPEIFVDMDDVLKQHIRENLVSLDGGLDALAPSLNSYFLSPVKENATEEQKAGYLAAVSAARSKMFGQGTLGTRRARR